MNTLSRFSSAAGRAVPKSVTVETFVKCKQTIIATVVTRRCVSARKTTNSLSRVQQIQIINGHFGFNQTELLLREARCCGAAVDL